MKKKLIITSAIAAVAVFWAFAAHQNDTAEPAPQAPSHMSGRLISQDDFTRAAEETVNGVVSVKSFATPHTRQSYGNQGSYYNDPLLDFFFGVPSQPRQRRQQPEEPRQQQQIGLGSGVIISADGYIVTNNHVIADAERLEVTLNDNRNFPATIVGADPTTDLALIKIEAPELHVIPMSDSEKLHVGEWVLAVGNPFGYTSTVTSGIVSAKARNISSSTGSPSSGGIESYIQTDAAVNQGNSGGALVNLDGELVGINTAIYSQTGAYAGCSFAIPTSIVQKVVSDIKSYGTVQRAYLGIRFYEVSPELVAEKKIEGTTSGIYVADIEERSAAREAGFLEGDVIVSIGGRPTRSTAQLQEVVAGLSPGDTVEVEFYRDGKKKTCNVTLRNNRGNLAITRPGDEANLGATLAAIDEDTARSLEIRGGVSVKNIDAEGRFAKAGVRENFIILGVNGKRVTSPDEIKAIVKQLTSSSAQVQDRVLFLSGIYPSGKTAYYAIPLDD